MLLICMDITNKTHRTRKSTSVGFLFWLFFKVNVNISFVRVNATAIVALDLQNNKRKLIVMANFTKTEKYIILSVKANS